MIIRLLQSFSDISLDLASAPKEAVPPADWAKGTGRKAIEKVRPKNHLTMYVRKMASHAHDDKLLIHFF